MPLQKNSITKKIKGKMVMGDHSFCHTLLRVTRSLPSGADSVLGGAGGLAT